MKIALIVMLLLYSVPFWKLRYRWRATVYRRDDWTINILPWFGHDFAALFTNRYFVTDAERRMARHFRCYLAGYVVLLALVAAWPPAAVDGAERQRRPNLIVVLVDDLGWQDTSVPLHESVTPLNRRYRTPNLERLAAQGLTFTNAYAAAPVCTPTRVSLITGRTPAETHVTNWVQRPDEETSGLKPLGPPAWNRSGLAPAPGQAQAFSSPLLPRLLRDAGYHTIHVGKAHWGAVGTAGADPLALGFDVNIGGSAAGQPGSYLSERNFRSSAAFRDVPHLEAYHGTGTFLTEAITIEATRAVSRAVSDGRPFFLHFAHFAVHTPLDADARFVQRYLDAGLDPAEAAYASLVEGWDKSLGDLWAQLERLGEADRTLLVFTSDNGGLAVGARGGPRHVHNAPLRSGKGSAYEGGIRVPMVIRWTGRVKPGARTDAPVITDDLFPTFLTAGGVANPGQYLQGIRGRNLEPIFSGDASAFSNRPLVWHYPHVWGPTGPGLEPFSAIRSGRWKLIFFYAARQYELYDLATDLGETRNLLDTNRAMAAELSARLVDHLRQANAQTPVDPATSAPVDLPPVLRAPAGG